jgi:hypothetical protein
MPARHQLEDIARLVAQHTFGTRALDKADELLSFRDRGKVAKYLRALIASLSTDDFLRAHDELYGGKKVECDDYAKLDRYGLWFIKLDITEGVLAVRSCHESTEASVILFSGKTLRNPNS